MTLVDEPDGNLILQGYSDEAGHFFGQLDSGWVGRDVYLVVREPSFKYDHFNPIRVERWGLFMAVKQEKDPVYIGSKGASTIDPRRWEAWDSTQEYIRASKEVLKAARTAKIAWPLRPVGLILSLAVGALGFLVHPVVGLVLGLAAFGLLEFLGRYLLTRGF